MASATTISASTSDEDLLDYLISISSGITPAELIRSLSKVPGGTNSKKIGALCIGASMNIRRVVNDLRAKTGVVLPEEWMVNGEINFTMFAMLGHLIMMIKDTSLTPAAKRAKNAYVKSIGGVANISMFSESTVLTGKDERKKILLKWSSMLKDFDINAHQSKLAKLFPNIIKDKRSIISVFFGGIYDIFAFPFRAAYRVATGTISSTSGIVKNVLMIMFIYAVALFMFRTIFMNIGNKVSEVVSITATTMPAEPSFAAAFKALGDSSSFATRAAYFLYAITTSSISFVSNSSLYAYSKREEIIDFIDEVLKSQGAILPETFEALVEQGAMEQAVDAVEEAVSTSLMLIVKTVTGEEPTVPDDTSYIKLVLKNLYEVFFNTASSITVASAEIPEIVPKSTPIFAEAADGATRKVKEKNMVQESFEEAVIRKAPDKERN